MHKNFKFSLKVGFGFRPSEVLPEDGLGWAQEQLELESYNSTLPELIVKNHRNILERSDYILKDRALDIRSLAIKKNEARKMGKSTKAFRNSEIELSVADNIRHALNAIYGENQVNQRFVHFWMNHFTVGNVGYTAVLQAAYDKEAIAKNLKGNFSEMLYDAITHPSMLKYLDNIHNIGPNSKTKSGSNDSDGLNDNLAREVLELHTVTPAVEYTEADIHEMAKILTGWGFVIDNEKENGLKLINKTKDLRKPFVAENSEPGKSNLLGKRVSNFKKGLREMLEHLARHPATVTACCKKLLGHFVSDNPKQEHIEQLVDVWTVNDGYLPAVHSKVLEIAFNTDEVKLNWPSTWAYQMSRTHGGIIKFTGDRKARDILMDLGMSFWSVRQPNGYSSKSSDWISQEYLDRRLRYVNFSLWNSRDFQRIEEIATRMKIDGRTLEAIKSNDNTYERLAILYCSPDFMFV